MSGGHEPYMPLLARKIADQPLYLPLVALDAQASLPHNALPFATRGNAAERLIARLRAAIRIRTLHATVLRRIEDPDGIAAILPDTESGLEKWLELNSNFSADWPNVTRKNDQTPTDADEHKGEEGKYDKYFKPEPGKGD